MIPTYQITALNNPPELSPDVKILLKRSKNKLLILLKPETQPHCHHQQKKNYKTLNPINSQINPSINASHIIID